jgi:N-dimethylarginine dimethylaminohydrolase
MPRLLLCPPDYYGIEYEINPWMDRTHNASPDLARAQWTRLKETLRSLGCQIELVLPQPKLPDMVFTANAGLVSGKKFIPSTFRFPQRQGEEVFFRNWFLEHGYRAITLPDDLYFEGEGDALFCGEVLFCGYRFRSDIRSHQKIGETLNCLAISVELVQDRFYHLDTCFCPLTSESAIWYPAAFDEYGQRAIRHHVKQLVDVEPEEAAHFACNAVVLGRDIVLADNSPKLVAALRGCGFRTHELAMTEFIKAGGACKCLTLFI